MALKFARDEPRRNKHVETKAQFDSLLTFLESVRQTNEPIDGQSQRTKKPVQLALTFAEVQGLPKELLEELSLSDGDKLDYAILKIIEDCGGIASLDRLLVGIYKDTGEVMKRGTLTSRMYRMSQRGMVYTVPGKKGAYSLRELTEAEVSGLLGD